MKNTYEIPKATILKINTADVITTSPAFTASDFDVLEDAWLEMNSFVN